MKEQCDACGKEREHENLERISQHKLCPDCRLDFHLGISQLMETIEKEMKTRKKNEVAA